MLHSRKNGVRLQQACRRVIVVRLPQPGVAVGQERGCAVVLSNISKVYFLFFVIKLCSGKPDTDSDDNACASS
jgi:hypothetical protein